MPFCLRLTHWCTDRLLPLDGALPTPIQMSRAGEPKRVRIAKLHLNILGTCSNFTTDFTIKCSEIIIYMLHKATIHEGYFNNREGQLQSCYGLF